MFHGSKLFGIVWSILRDGKGGLLAEPNSRALAREIIRFESNPAVARKLARDAKGKAKEFDLARLTKRLVGFYEETIEIQKAAKVKA